jgi:ketosteroid isomerase-like protein
MQDIQGYPDRLRADAAECRLIRDRAFEQAKRDLFARLATHLETLATEVERVIAATPSDERTIERSDARVARGHASHR